MTIDEAIAHERKNVEDNKICNFENIVQYHKQLAEWLEELKTYRECNICEYNKAIDDAKSVILQTLDNEILVDTLNLRLEQLKVGVDNE